MTGWAQREVPVAEARLAHNVHLDARAHGLVETRQHLERGVEGEKNCWRPTERAHLIASSLGENNQSGWNARRPRQKAL